MTTAAKPAPLFIGKCSNGHSVQGTAWDFVSNCKIACACGVVAIVRGMNVTIKPDHNCGARCTSATGPNCECSCAGQRHGLDLRA